MKRIQIKKNGIVTNQCELPALEADAWLQKHLSRGTFGTDFEVVETDVTSELEQARTNSEALAFLAKTDFYAIRFAEEGIPYSDEIKLARQEARSRIVR